MFSIIIPVHNSLKILSENLKNICSQIEASDEIIVVDDKSDNAIEIKELAYSYNAKYYYINPHSTYNRCLAINTGVKNASNKWIVELDQDKIPNSNDYFKAIREEISKNDDYKIVRFGHTTNHFPIEIKLKYIDKNNKATFNAIVGGNTCYSKQLFNEVGGYDTKFDGNKGFQDFDLFYRFQKHGAKLCYIKSMLADHVDSHQKTNQMYKKNMSRFFNKHGFYPEVD
ncbi:MAG: glycosyltransferase family A protein [Candidatus Paceibacterota bacterium]|nr:MAG: glycosyltransferase family A protein [Candidatus Paceibacterota bacterium]